MPYFRSSFAPLFLAVFALVACSSTDKAPVAAGMQAAPASWSGLKQVEGMRVALVLPSEIPAKAALIQAVVSLANESGESRTLTVPTPCDIEQWRVLDAAGKQVMIERPALCEQREATKTLQPAESLQQTVYLYLDPRVLQAGQTYTIEYRYWGQEGVTRFTAN